MLCDVEILITDYWVRMSWGNNIEKQPKYCYLCNTVINLIAHVILTNLYSGIMPPFQATICKCLNVVTVRLFLMGVLFLILQKELILGLKSSDRKGAFNYTGSHDLFRKGIIKLLEVTKLI